MHFSIPDTQELNNDNGTAYMGFNIHINGVYHCTVRYKQLHSLHEQLHQQYPALKLPSFPPKKILPLTNSQLEERRAHLEKYVQCVGQNSILSNSDLLIGFLIWAQQESQCESRREVPLDVYLMNGYRITLTVLSTDRSDQVLDKACAQIHLSSDFIKYFSLFLLQVGNVNNQIIIVKKLEDFESPYISHKALRPNHKIVIRKRYWDPSYDLELMLDHVALELLYTQTVAEVQAGWISAPPNVLAQLHLYEETNRKREYVDLARNQRHYGCVMGGEGQAEWGASRGPAQVFLGSLGLSLVTQEGREPCFKVTRMKCWRITTLRMNEDSPPGSNGHLQNGSGHSSTDAPQLEISFEYLMNKDKLQWVTILSERAMFMSVCLQSIVDELMRQKNYGGLLGNGQRSTVYRGTFKRNSLTYIRRDGSSQIITPSSSTDTLSSGNGDSSIATTPKETFSIRRLSEKFASVSFKSGRDCVENDAFEGIGDEDL